MVGSWRKRLLNDEIIISDISEPSTDLNCNTIDYSKDSYYTLGIDLGTTYSLVAAIVHDKKTQPNHLINLSNDILELVQVLQVNDQDAQNDQIDYELNGTHNTKSTNNSSKYLFPSAFYPIKDYAGGQIKYDLGWDAKRHLAHDSQNVISSYKRIIDSNHQFITNNGKFSPIEITSIMLGALVDKAHKIISISNTGIQKDNCLGVVITVPAYFNDQQRNATIYAASQANIKVLRILNEPTAAAIAYGIQNNSPDDNCSLTKNNSKILIYDFGGGTFDVSILSLKDDVFTVLAVGGNTTLGGDDIDNLMIDYIYHKYLGSHQISIDNYHQKNSINKNLYLEKIRVAKEELSINNIATIEIENKIISISRDEFEQIITPIIDQTVSISLQVLQDANLELDELDKIILVGGSSQIPLVANKLHSAFKKMPLCSINPSQVVAIGASIYANNLVQSHNNENKFLLLDVLPISIGIETMGGFVEKIITKNTTLPVVGEQYFTTQEDGQSAISIAVVQGESELKSNCIELARFIFDDLTPMPAGTIKIKISFHVDVNGILIVSATENIENKNIKFRVEKNINNIDHYATHAHFQNNHHSLSSDSKINSDTQSIEKLLFRIKNALLRAKTVRNFCSRNFCIVKGSALKEHIEEDKYINQDDVCATEANLNALRIGIDKKIDIIEQGIFHASECSNLESQVEELDFLVDKLLNYTAGCKSQ